MLSSKQRGCSIDSADALRRPFESVHYAVLYYTMYTLAGEGEVRQLTGDHQRYLRPCGHAGRCSNVDCSVYTDTPPRERQRQRAGAGCDASVVLYGSLVSTEMDAPNASEPL